MGFRERWSKGAGADRLKPRPNQVARRRSWVMFLLHIGAGLFAMDQGAGLDALWEPLGQLSGPANPKIGLPATLLCFG